MTFHLTQDHINRGIKQSPDHCPIALSISEMLHRNVFVEDGVVRIVDERQRTLDFRLTLDMVNFIVYFDGGNPCEPFEFDLPVDNLVKESSRQTGKEPL